MSNRPQQQQQQQQQQQPQSQRQQQQRDPADIAISRVSHLLSSWDADSKEHEQKITDYGLDVLEAPLVSGAGVNHRGELDDDVKRTGGRKAAGIDAGVASPAGRAWMNKSDYVDVEKERGATPKQTTTTTTTTTSTSRKMTPKAANDSLRRLSPMRAGALVPVRAGPAAKVAAVKASSSIPALRRKPPVAITKPSSSVLHGLKLEEPEPEPADWWHEQQQQQHEQQNDAEAAAARAQEEQDEAVRQEAFKARPKLRMQTPEEIQSRVADNDPASTGRFQKARTPPPSTRSDVSSRQHFPPQQASKVVVGKAPPRPSSAREAVNQIDKPIPVSRRVPTSPSATIVHKNDSGRLVPPPSSSTSQHTDPNAGGDDHDEEQHHQQQQQRGGSSTMPTWLRDQYKRMWQKKRAEHKAKEQQHQQQPQRHQEQEQTSRVSFSDDVNDHHHQQQQHHECVCDVSAITNTPEHEQPQQEQNWSDYRQQRFDHHRAELTQIDDKSQRAFADRNNTASVANYHFAEAERHMAEAALESARFRNGGSRTPPPSRISYQTALGRRFAETPMTEAQHAELERRKQEQYEREEEQRRQRRQASMHDTHRAAIQRSGSRREEASFQQRKTVDLFWNNDVSSPEGLREAREQKQAEKDFYKTAAEMSATPHSRGSGAGGMRAAAAANNNNGSIMHHSDAATSRMFSQNSIQGGDSGPTAVCVTQTIEDTGPPPVTHFVSPLGKLQVPNATTAASSIAGDAAVRSFYGDLESAAPDANSRRHNITSPTRESLVLSGDGTSAQQHTADVHNSKLTHSMLHELHDERWDAVPGAQYRDQEATRGLSGMTRNSQLQWRDSLRDNTRSNVRTPFSTTITPMLEVDSKMYTMVKPAPIDAQGRVVGAPSGIQQEIMLAGAATSGATLGSPTAMVAQTPDLSMRQLCPQNGGAKSFSQLYQEKQERAARAKHSTLGSDGGGGGGGGSVAGGAEPGGEENENNRNSTSLFGGGDGDNNNNNSRSNSATGVGGGGTRQEDWLLRKKQLWRERASKKRAEEMRLQEELRQERELQGSKRPSAMADITNSNRNTAMTSLTGKESFASPLLGGKAKGLARRRATTPGDKYRVAVAALEKVVEENERNAALLAESEAEAAKQRKLNSAESASNRTRKSAATVSVVSSPTITKVDASKVRRGVSFGDDASASGGGGGLGGGTTTTRSGSVFDNLETASAISGITSACSDVSGGGQSGTTAMTTQSAAAALTAAAGGGRPMSPKEKKKAQRLELAYDRAEKFAREQPVPGFEVSKPSDQRHHHSVLSPKRVAQFLPENFSLLSDGHNNNNNGAAVSSSSYAASPRRGAVGGVSGGHSTTDIVAARAVTRAVKAAADDEERQRNFKSSKTPAWKLSAEEEDERAERERLRRSEWSGVANAEELDAAASAAAKRRQPWAAFRDHSKEAPRKKVFGNAK